MEPPEGEVASDSHPPHLAEQSSGAERAPQLEAEEGPPVDKSDPTDDPELRDQEGFEGTAAGESELPLDEEGVGGGELVAADGEGEEEGFPRFDDGEGGATTAADEAELPEDSLLVGSPDAREQEDEDGEDREVAPVDDVMGRELEDEDDEEEGAPVVAPESATASADDIMGEEQEDEGDDEEGAPMLAPDSTIAVDDDVMGEEQEDDGDEGGEDDEEAPFVAPASFAPGGDDDVMGEEQEHEGEEEAHGLGSDATTSADVMGQDDVDDDVVGDEATDNNVLVEEATDTYVMGEKAADDITYDDEMGGEATMLAVEETLDDVMEEPEPTVAASRRGGGRQKRVRPSAIEEEEEEEEEQEGAPVLEPASTMGAGDDFVGEDDTQMAVEEEEQLMEPTKRGGGKRKRGRPPKSQAGRATARRKEEEEVCFICFDGGDLVVCDRRGCPKVYHPACVNREESFFRSKGRWNCGWHICSICQKSAHFMCYTCTYSLCKGCVKEAAGFVCVRGNKGFCETCLSTVMLIEKNEHANNIAVGVDFDDKSSWMHMFKDYWLELKGKLSLTFEELDKARTSRKGLNISAHNEESSDELYDVKNDQGANSDSSSERRGGKLSRKKVKKRSRKSVNEEVSVKEIDNEVMSAPEDVEWASKELLELVVHMRDGDKSFLSQFDVQNLLLEYIKRNNLRDPRRKSQIICDSMLQNLFGKPRVGHFEMLKLLESHFLIKENSQLVTDDSQGGVVDPDSNQVDAEGNSDASTKMSSDKKRKTRKRFEEREPQTNLDDYAAIDVHNINLMYLRRNLMEDLIDDVEGFNEKVVGSFVRIRISGSGQRQDIYRLVQVIGTRKAAEKYKTGKKVTDILLEILNLSKTEVITMDIISNQEFTEEECKRLRQSIKCGLIGRLTVGEVQEKARLLQAVRVNDWLENEKSRLGHLRDRASEQGRRKQLRECVERLELLSMPEERIRRLNEVPEIHADPNMDPDYESAEDEVEPDDKKGDSYDKQMESASFKKGREVTSPGKGGSASRNSWSSSRKSSNTTWESNRNTLTEGTRDRVDSLSAGDGTSGLSLGQGNDVLQASWENPSVHVSAIGLEAGAWNANQPGISPAQSSGVPPETTSTSPSTGVVVPSSVSETEKMWHYQDPSGKIQGPFSMTQLRKWNTTGYFPSTLRIWRTSERQEDSILLADALNGKFQKDLPQPEPQHNSFAQSTNLAAINDRQSNPDGSLRGNNWQGNWRGSNTPASTGSSLGGGNWSGNQNDASTSAAGVSVPTKAESWATQPSTWSVPKTEAVNSSRGWESSMNVNAWAAQSQGHSSPGPAALFSGNPYRSPPHQGRGGRGGNSGRWHGNQDRGNAWSSNRPRGSRPGGQGYERQHPNWSSPSQQSSSEHWKVQQGIAPSNQWGNDPFNLPTPTTPQPSSVGWMGVHGASNQFPPTASAQPMGSGWGNTPRGNETNQTPIATNELNLTTPTAYSSSGWGLNSPSLSMPVIAKVAETVNSVQFPEKAHVLGNLQTLSQQIKPPESNAPRVELTANNDVPTFSNSTSIELKDVLDKKQSLGSDCTSPTPRCEQQEANDVLSSEYSQQNPSQLDGRQECSVVSNIQIDSGKRSPKELDGSAVNSNVAAEDSGGSDVVSVAIALTNSDFPNPVCLGDNLQSKTSVSAEDANKQGLLSQMEISEIHLDASNTPVPLVGPEDKQIHSVSSSSVAINSSLQALVPDTATSKLGYPNVLANAIPKSELNDSESFSAQRAGDTSDLKSGSDTQVWSPISAPKQEPDGLPAPEVNLWQQNQTQNRESSLPRPEHVNSGNHEVPTDIKSSAWSMPSPTPAAKPSGSDGADNASVNSQNTQSHSSDNSRLIASSEMKANASSEPAHQSNTGWGVIPQNLNPLAVQGQGNGNLGWGSAVQGNISSGWGTIVPGGMNVAWGIPAQGNANVNLAYVAPAQANSNVNPVWTTVTQGNTSVNLGLAAPTQGNMNTTAGWGTSTQGNATPNSSWANLPQGGSNSAAGNIAHNMNWGASSNASSGWGSGQSNMNQPWDPSAGNPNSWTTQQSQNGDGNSGHGERSFHGGDSGHGGGRHSWNRMQSSGGGGSSRPPRGGQTGICRFHESGYCKKGANCNYIHL